MIDTLVIPNLMSEEESNKIEELIMTGPWKFVKDMSYDNSLYPSYGFSQPLKHPNYGIISNLYEAVCVPIINKVIYNLPDCKIDDIFNAKAFLQVPLSYRFVKETNGVHVDLATSHIAGVYYCCDSDGDTIIYDQTSDIISGGTNNVKLTVHKRVTPKKNTIVLFNGKRYHCSSQPKNNHRCIINFNLV